MLWILVVVVVVVVVVVDVERATINCEVKLEAGSCLVNIARNRRDFEKHVGTESRASHPSGSAATDLTLTPKVSEAFILHSSFPPWKEKFFLAFIKVLKSVEIRSQSFLSVVCFSSKAELILLLFSFLEIHSITHHTIPYRTCTHSSAASRFSFFFTRHGSVCKATDLD
jgi:hypothetical protein